ncbi:MAG: hypothetical protein E7607_02480 [Ruminococcaceae bacterium]|nr:hypothetical protein [Oscillospiraceae bacterium]
MSFCERVLRNDERAIYGLRELYESYGYSLYKVSKFEEYDLYAHNKSFLVSSNILSFTDTNGKLLALKPDVTLSIVKNISDEDKVTHKFCYNETVYRTSADSDGFKEIMQTGLECIGDIDLYSECEVLALAVRSLSKISADYLLDLSHMGIVDGLLCEAGIDDALKSDFIAAIKSKNVSAINALCNKNGISPDMENKLCELTGLYLPLDKALAKVSEIIVGDRMNDAYSELCNICEVMKAEGMSERIFVDFSVVNDVNYYDGVCFKGFINGIPDSVLSGGRYDKLLRKLDKKQGAIGFAVYLDRLERFDSALPEYDVDIVLTYDKGTDVKKIIEAKNELAKDGARVLVGEHPDKSQRYRKLLKITDGGVVTLEAND